MGRVVDLSTVGRRFVGWWRLSILGKLSWLIRKAIGFGVAYVVAMAAILAYNDPAAVERVVAGAPVTLLIDPALALGPVVIVVAVGVAFAVLVPTMSDPGRDSDGGIRFRL